MKKKAFLEILIILVIAIVVLTFPKKQMNEVIANTHFENDNSSMISMMLETSKGSGTYTASDNTTWPEDGYNLNVEKSGCENGGKLTFDEDIKKVVVKTNISDKCYVYFDQYTKTTVTASVGSITTSGFTITANTTAGSSAVDAYYFSIDNGATWKLSSTNSMSYTGLTENTTYNIKVKVVDINGKESKEYSTTGKTYTYLGNHIKSLYTSQGSNGIYYHTSTLANSAGDNSYRYSGANPNNWICFGSTASTCHADNLYRIIGIFGSYIKLIKNTSVGSYDYEDGIAYVNGTYLTNLTTTWSNKIYNVTWKKTGAGCEVGFVDGCDVDFNGTAKEYYTSENGSGSTSTAKIGLMYVSEYGFGATNSYWSTKLGNYTGARNSNWLDLGVNEWSFTPYNGRFGIAYYILANGNVSGLNELYKQEEAGVEKMAIRPTFNISTSSVLTSGSGTQDNPYRIQ